MRWIHTNAHQFIKDLIRAGADVNMKIDGKSIMDIVSSSSVLENALLPIIEYSLQNRKVLTLGAKKQRPAPLLFTTIKDDKTSQVCAHPVPQVRSVL